MGQNPRTQVHSDTIASAFRLLCSTANVFGKQAGKATKVHLEELGMCLKEWSSM